MIKKLIKESAVDTIKKYIEDARKIVIVSHVGPDGDALGSSLGLYHYLKNCGKQEVDVIVPTQYPSFLNWFPAADQITIHKKSREKAEKLIAEASHLFVLDLNTVGRLAEMGDAIRVSKAKKVMIDHHLHPEIFTDVMVSHPEIASTSELIYRLIVRLGDIEKIDLNTAEAIYAGMMTDTGGFTYNSNNPDIYAIIKALLAVGIDKDEIYRKTFNHYSADRMRLMGYCLYKKMRIYPEYKTALITLDKKDLKKFNYQNGDAEGFVNIPLQVADVQFSVMMREDPDKIKISLRSEGTFPANKFASEVFNGGGHLNASGGESYTTLDTAIQKFESALPEYQKLLEGI